MPLSYSCIAVSAFTLLRDAFFQTWNFTRQAPAYAAGVSLTETTELVFAVGITVCKVAYKGMIA